MESKVKGGGEVPAAKYSKKKKREIKQISVCLLLSPLRCGGPRPICWFMPNGSWGFGFMALVCRAESELVLSRRKRRVMPSIPAPWTEAEGFLKVGRVSESLRFLLCLHAGGFCLQAHADLTLTPSQDRTNRAARCEENTNCLSDEIPPLKHNVSLTLICYQYFNR